jgi:hypothetical protein
MVEMNVSLVLTSAVHVPERKLAYDELRKQLHPERWASVHEEVEKAPNWQWAAHAWDWAADQDTLGTVFLQEDIDLAPDFEDRIARIVACRPDELIGIHCAHPGARRAYLDGYRWCSTRDGLIGVAYYMPTAVARELVTWRHRDLKARAYERISEDCLVDIWAMCNNRRIYHPLPAPMRHKVDMKSTYNNDEHLLRMTQVTWEDEARLGEGSDYEHSGVAWLGEFYAALPHHVMDLLEDREEAKRVLATATNPEPVDRKFVRFFNQVRGAAG